MIKTHCDYCLSEDIGHYIGMYFVAYQCHSCQHEWIEHFPITTGQEEICHWDKVNENSH